MLFELMVFTSVTGGLVFSLVKLGSLGLDYSYKLGSTSFNSLKQLIGFSSNSDEKKKKRRLIKKKNNKTKVKAFDRIKYFFHGASVIISEEINGIHRDEAFLKIIGKNEKELKAKTSKLKFC